METYVVTYKDHNIYLRDGIFWGINPTSIDQDPPTSSRLESLIQYRIDYMGAPCPICGTTHRQHGKCMSCGQHTHFYYTDAWGPDTWMAQCYTCGGRHIYYHRIASFRDYLEEENNEAPTPESPGSQ